MSKAYSIAVREGYVHVLNEPAFEIAHETVQQQLRDVVEACRNSGLRRVLVEGESPHRSLKTVEVFDAGALFSGLGLHGLSLAFCFPGYQPDDLSDFLATVAQNRATRIAFFQDRDAALEWLMKS